MFIAWQETDAMLESAAASFRDADGWTASIAAATKFHASRSAQFVADSAVQLHGGLGVSDEMSVSHHFKRIMVNEALFGNAEYQLDRFVAASDDGNASNLITTTNHASGGGFI
jgi:alkylation response protein AidB-like acyl-CoA dehydrogenase